MKDTPITIHKYTDFDEIKADEYRYWQSRPVHERLDTAAELSMMGYQLKDLGTPQMVEILPRISGVEFAQAWEHRIEAVVDERTGLKAFVISADDLIANKTAFGRPYDLADVDAIHKAQESQRRGAKKPPEPSGPNR